MTNAINYKMPANYKLQAIHFPGWTHGNPYLTLLAKSLVKHNIDVDFVSGHKILIKKVLTKKVDILHVHWVHRSLLGKNILSSIVKSFGFIIILVIAKINGIKLFWTVHNLKNHENKFIKIEAFFSKLIAKLANAVFVHGESAVSIVNEKFSVSLAKIHIVPHGNYDGWYLPKSSCYKKRISHKPEANKRNFLFFGNIKQYKGLSKLLHVFINIEGDNRLVIAGSVRSKELEKEIELIASSDSRIELHLGFVPEHELIKMLHNADVAVLPFVDVFTSGSLLLALTFCLPVIAPNKGLIPDYVNDQCAFLYNPESKSGLEEAIRNAGLSDMLPDMGRCARKRADEFSWVAIGKKIAALYLMYLGKIS
jgi:beta-1,4-mannosyltransferase